MTFAYHITVCIRDIISTASNMIFKARVTMKFSCDIMVFIHNKDHGQSPIHSAQSLKACISDSV